MLELLTKYSNFVIWLFTQLSLAIWVVHEVRRQGKDINRADQDIKEIGKKLDVHIADPQRHVDMFRDGQRLTAIELTLARLEQKIDKVILNRTQGRTHESE